MVSRRVARFALAALARPALAVLLAGAAAAQSSPFIYAFNAVGNVSANAYPLDALPSSTSSLTTEETWQALFVHGPDRWLIRGDGVVERNGSKVTDLAEDSGWRGIVVDDAGDFFAMKKGGRVSGPSGVIVNYDAGSFSFSDIQTDGTAVFVLKSNGAVFRVPETDPIVKFNGPPGEISGASNDGEAPDTFWTRLLVNPVDGRLWALRRDGVIKSADVPVTPPVTPDGGTLEASLPYNDSDGVISVDELYRGFTFDTDGTWYALRSDGRLFSVSAQGPPLVDLPGSASDNVNETYVSVVAFNGQTLALRQDGKVYRNTTTSAITDLKNSNYVGLALGTEFPDLTKVKNQPPVGSSMTVVAPEGADVVLPVIVADRDKPAADLVVDVVAGTLPAGATWDGPSRTISWPAAGPAGNYKVKVTVSDGIAKPVTKTQTITIKPLDGSATNIKPAITKAAGVVALVALPFQLPVSAYALDGDAVTLSIDASSPLPTGASFDDVANLLTWNAPTVADKGGNPFRFIADDGTATSKRTITVQVKTSLLAF